MAGLPRQNTGRLLLAAALVGSALGLGCGTAQPGGLEHSAAPQAQTPTAAVETAVDALGPFPIATPGQIHASLRGVRQASSITTHDGSDYLDSYSQRMTPAAPSAQFGPAWADGSCAFDTVAYAVYRFDLTARTGRLTLNSEWIHQPHTPPLDYSRVWIGASNWQRDRWDWYSGAEAGVVQPDPGSMSLYKHAETSEMYVAVVVLGQNSMSLRRVWLSGFSMRGDWWMGGRDPGHTSCSPFTGPDSPTVLWHIRLAGNPNSPVYDADGTLYLSAIAMQNTYFYAIRPDGTEKWVYQAAGDTGGMGIGSFNPIPAVDDDGSIYFCGYKLPLYALYPDGKVKWSFGEHQYFHGQVAIGPQGNLYVSGIDTGAHPGEASDVTCFMQALRGDGAALWDHYQGYDFLSSPTLGRDEAVYYSCDDGLIALAADGSLKWNFTAAGENCRMPSVGRDGRVYFTNLVVGADYAYYSDWRSALYALSPDGEQVWSSPLPTFTRQLHPALGPDGAIHILGEDERLYVFNPDGTLRWTYRVGFSGLDFSAPMVDARGTVYVNGGDYRLYAINADGTLKWWLVLPTADSSQPVMAEDGTLYVTSGQELFAIGPGSTLQEYTAAGCVKDSGGNGVEGVTISLTGEEPVLTAADGSWSKSGLADGMYLVAATKEGYDFSPLFAELEISGADAVVDDFVEQPQPAAQWPMWGYSRKHTGSCPYTGPASGAHKWQVQLGQPLRYQPAIAGDGTVYVTGAMGGLWALNPDGTTRWSAAQYYPQFPPGPSAPAIGLDRTVYVLSNRVLVAFSPGGVFKWSSYLASGLADVLTLADDGTLIASGMSAVNPDGTPRWRFIPSKLVYAPLTPAIADDGMLYVNGNEAVLAVSPQLIETWEARLDGLGKGGAETFAPALGPDGAIYVACGRQLYALNPDGSERWVHEFEHNLSSNPALGADGTLFVAHNGTDLANRRLWALDADGAAKWSYASIAYAGDGSPWLPSPVVDAAGTVYAPIGDTGGMYAFNPDGTVHWFVDTQSDTSPVALSADGTVYFGDSRGNFHAIGPGGG